MPSDIDKTTLLTDMQRLFLEHLGGEAKGNIRLAMDMAGYSKNTATGEVMKSLRNEIREVAELLMATNSVKAVHSILDVMEHPNMMGASNKLGSANSLLDRVGMGKKEDKPTVITVQPIFFLPEKQEQVPFTIEQGVNKVIDNGE